MTERERQLDKEYERADHDATEALTALAKAHREAGLTAAEVVELWHDALADAQAQALREAYA